MIGHAAFGPVETPYIMAGNNVGDRETTYLRVGIGNKRKRKAVGSQSSLKMYPSLLDNQDLPLGFTSLWVCVSAEIH